MNLFHHILVPLDGSPHATKALKVALDLARLTNARVEAIHVIDMAQVRQIAHLLNKSVEQVRGELKNKALSILCDADCLARQAGMELATHVAEGIPYEVIVDYADKQGVDLIVIGRIGTRGPRRILIGSVTERILEAARCDVLVVR
ncbi:MAG: universal stress protein [Nitrospirae bacterium]|nr:MAG: universal stress protein [Nitrospirota bacterium]